MKLKAISAAVLFSVISGAAFSQSTPDYTAGGVPLVSVPDRPVLTIEPVPEPTYVAIPDLVDYVSDPEPVAPVMPDGYTPFAGTAPTISKVDAHTSEYYESSAYGVDFARTVFDTNGAYDYNNLVGDRFDAHAQYNIQTGTIDEGQFTLLAGKTYQNAGDSVGSSSYLSKTTVEQMKAVLSGESAPAEVIVFRAYSGGGGFAGETGDIYVTADGAYIKDAGESGGYRKLVDGADLLADIEASLTAAPDRTEGVSATFYDETSPFYAAFDQARQEHQAAYGAYEADLDQYNADRAAWEAANSGDLAAYNAARDAALAQNASIQTAYNQSLQDAQTNAEAKLAADLAEWDENRDAAIVDAINNKIPNLRGLGGGYAPGENAVAFGPGALADGDNSVATGSGAWAAGQGAVAVGNNASALQAGAIAIGDGALAESVGSVAIGAGAYAKSSVAVGIGAQAVGGNTTAIGDFAVATGNKSVSIGANSSAPGDNSVAIGSDTVADEDNTVAVGGRRVTQVADPVSGTDAVNARYLEQRLQEIQPLDTEEILSQSRSYTDAQINKLDKRLSAGIAAVAATPSMPALAAGERAIAAGVATYNGQQALSIGYGHALNNTDYVTASIAASTQGRPVFRASLAKKF